jgi:hypothetical protein
MRSELSRTTVPAARCLIILVVLTIADDLLAEHSEQRCARVLVGGPGVVHCSAGVIKTNHATCRVFAEVDVR